MVVCAWYVDGRMFDGDWTVIMYNKYVIIDIYMTGPSARELGSLLRVPYGWIPQNRKYGTRRADGDGI